MVHVHYQVAHLEVPEIGTERRHPPPAPLTLRVLTEDFPFGEDLKPCAWQAEPLGQSAGGDQERRLPGRGDRRRHGSCGLLTSRLPGAVRDDRRGQVIVPQHLAEPLDPAGTFHQEQRCRSVGRLLQIEGEILDASLVGSGRGARDMDEAAPALVERQLGEP